MAVKRYDGTAWQVVAGKGEAGQAATSSSIATWVKTATGGETSVSGNDDNSQPLSYTVGQELVFINGALQKRGADYTATTGNSITGLTALTAGDIVSVWTVNAFSVTNAISNTLVDAKGDLIVATGADTPGRLAVGSNNQVLTADSTTGTGLKWATPAAGGMTLIESGNLSGSSVTTGSIPNTYENLQVLLKNVQPGTDGAVVTVRLNSDTGTNYSLLAYGAVANANFGATFVQIFEGIDNTAGNTFGVLYFPDYANTTTWKIFHGFGLNKSHDTGTYDWTPVTGLYNSTSAISTITFGLNNGSYSAGTYEVWGIK